jgi:RNA polymerase primary sigma factor
MHDSARSKTVQIVETYLSEVGRYPLLSAQEEIDLAAAYQRGRAARHSQAARSQAARSQAARSQGAAGTRDARVQRTLEKAIARGERARKRMIECNLRLVIHLARPYASRGLPLEDLVQEGNIGLMKAVERFDPRRGVRFATYASWWIKKAMRRASVDQGRAIPLPPALREALHQLWASKARLEARLERPPTIEELAAELGVSVHRVRQVQRWDRTTLSLETPVGSNTDCRLADLIPDRNAPPLDETMARQQLQQRLWETMVAHLAPRELTLLRVRFGLDGSPGQTLKQAARELGLTQTRARQVEKRALKQLRHTGVLNEFR